MKNHKNSRLKTDVRVCFIVSDDYFYQRKIRGRRLWAGRTLILSKQKEFEIITVIC